MARFHIGDGRLVLDTGVGALLRDGQPEAVQPLVLQLLDALVRRPGELVERDTVVATLWPDTVVTDHSLHQVVRRARVALGKAGGLQTVRGRGFRLTVPVRVEATRAAEAVYVEPDGFFGRERELAAVDEALASGSRLVTLSGPAGVGKTRLAQRLAARHQSRGGTVHWVSLQTARDEADVVQAVSEALSLDGVRSAADLGFRLARLDAMLLVLDEVEHVVDVTPATVGRWLAAAPTLAVLATSRTVLGLRGERVVSVEPLSLADGVALFVDRSSTPADASAVEALVDALDGLPLAIELAAARTRLLPPEELLARLSERFVLLRTRRRDRSARHSSLQAALEDSWEPLPDDERTTLVCIATFRGTFGVDDAAAVVPESPAVVDGLHELVERSLLRVTEPGRFALLTSIRDYVEERGDPGIRQAAEAAHGRHFARFNTAEVLRHAFLARDSAERRALFAAQPDLDVACERAVARGDGTVAFQTVRAATAALRRRGWQPRLVALLQSVQSVCSDADRGALGGLLGTAYAGVDDHRASLQVFEEAHAHCRSRGDARGEAEAALGIGKALARLRDLPRATTMLQAALEGYLAVGDAASEGIALLELGTVSFFDGQHADAIGWLERADAAFARAGVERGRASVLGNMALAYKALGRLPEAEQAHRRAIAMCRDLNDPWGAANGVANLATHLKAMGRHDEAEEAYREALGVWRELGLPTSELRVWVQLVECLLARGDVEAAAAAVSQGQALCRVVEDPVLHVGVLANEAAVLEAQGQTDDALAVLGRALAREGDPRLAQARHQILAQRAALFLKLRRGDEARRDLDAVEAELPDVPGNLMVKRLGRLREALTRLS